jgi:hypothetical protein
MFRSLAALLFAPLAASAAPGVKEKAAPLYYPTRVGDSRLYELRTGGETSAHRDIVTAVEAKDGVHRVTLSRVTEGEPEVMGLVEVSAKGVYRLRSGGVTFKSPLPVVKLPVKPGETWDNRADSDAGAAALKKFTLVGEEEVEVPAGKFKAVRLDSETGPGADTVRTSSWYAPRVGLVKMKTVRDGTETLQVLKSFTPGK